MFNSSSEFTVQIFVPVHKDTHWCLAVINVKNETLQYLDSIGGMDTVVLRNLVSFADIFPFNKSRYEIILEHLSFVHWTNSRKRCLVQL